MINFLPTHTYYLILTFFVQPTRRVSLSASSSVRAKSSRAGTSVLLAWLSVLSVASRSLPISPTARRLFPASRATRSWSSMSSSLRSNRWINLGLATFCCSVFVLSKNGVLKGFPIASIPVISDLFFLFLAQLSDAFSRDEDIARSPASLSSSYEP